MTDTSILTTVPSGFTTAQMAGILKVPEKAVRDEVFFLNREPSGRLGTLPTYGPGVLQQLRLIFSKKWRRR
jgi:hypothetical protein